MLIHKLNNMEQTVIYQSVMTCGYGDEHYTATVYVGCDYQLAKQRCLGYKFPSEINQFGSICHWIDGKYQKEEIIVEP